MSLISTLMPAIQPIARHCLAMSRLDGRQRRDHHELEQRRCSAAKPCCTPFVHKRMSAKRLIPQVAHKQRTHILANSDSCLRGHCTLPVHVFEPSQVIFHAPHRPGATRNMTYCRECQGPGHTQSLQDLQGPVRAHIRPSRSLQQGPTAPSHTAGRSRCPGAASEGWCSR
jgi:hypothetical protein